MITIYSKDNCTQCEQAKTLLKNNNIEYSEIKISYGGAENFNTQYISRDDFVAQYPNVRAMPFLVFSNGDELGGLQNLRSYINSIKTII